MRTSSSRVLAAIVALGVCLGLTACVPGLIDPFAGGNGSSTDPSDADDTTDPDDPSDAAEAPVVLDAGPSSTAIDWRPCDHHARFDCAEVLLPLDHADPGGDQVRIALRRLPAGGPEEERLGTLWINPGGPGESGIDLVTMVGSFFGDDLLERYDVVGFDPRGVGASTHVVCLLDGEDDPSWVDLDLDTPKGLARVESGFTALGELCRERSGALLDHVSTADTVADLEALRALTGEQLNYLGYSYGTLIGAVYADTYPERVGRMVLDGAIDPSVGYTDLQAQQTWTFQRAFARFVTTCREDADCPLDADPRAAETQVLDWIDELDVSPVPSDAEDGELTGQELVAALASALYAPWDWDVVVEDLADAVADSDPDGSALDELQGEWYGGALNYPFWFSAIDCVDYPVGTFDEAVTHARELAAGSPVFGAGSIAEIQCATWPAKARDERVPVSATGAAPILVVGTLFDPATPYAWAVSLSRQLESATLLTYEGDGHAVYGGVSWCVDGFVEDYLIDGAVPPPGMSCPSAF